MAFRRALLPGVLLLLAGCASAPAPPRRPALGATPTATVVPVPPTEPTPVPPPLVPPRSPIPPPAPAVGDLDPPLVRVLLVRGAEATLPQPGRPYRAVWDGGATWLWGPVTMRPSPATTWQVGAWGDPAAAAAAAEQLVPALPKGAEVLRRAGDDGLERVQVSFPDGPANARDLIAAAGFPGAFAVPGAASVRVVGAGGGVVEAAEVRLEPSGDWPTDVGQRRYRGRFVARAAGGEVLLINELNMESYLLGVVPVEMGPAVFPELEALKAQAVAARTYAVAHLGDHDAEGYDLCATPACQAYHGFGSEHSLSTRAVRETAGLIATYEGVPIDAMYTSTCGGHTEDAAVLFPDRAQPYLRGVACRWERPLVLTGTGVDGPWLPPAQAAERLADLALGLSPGQDGPDRVLAAVAAACGRSRGLTAVPTDVDGWTAALLDVCGLSDAAIRVGRSTAGVDGLLALSDLYGAALDPPSAAWQTGWQLAAAGAALEIAGVLTRDSGEAVPRPDGVGIYPRRASASETLPSPLPLVERWGGAVRERARLEVAPGTRLERVRRGDRVISLAAVRSDGDGEADRRSAWREWVRERDWTDLASRVGVPDLARLEVTARGVSGRVVGLAAVGRGGQRREFSGFEIRRVLDLPETLFAMVPVTRPDGSGGIRFLGRGWGHGIGLCQNGAYGLARAGRSFDAILATYYQGITLTRWDAVTTAARPTP